MNKINILFVCWDSGQSNYLESLFLPIFSKFQEDVHVKVHVIQFSWANPSKIDYVRKIASDFNINFHHHKVYKKPFPIFMTVFTAIFGSFNLLKFIFQNNIKIIIPRATMPAVMVNRIRYFLQKKRVKVIFDSDGFPLEERLDYNLLNPTSRRYQFLKGQEDLMINFADKVLTRSNKAIQIINQRLPNVSSEKFYKILNGSDQHFFKFNESARIGVRRFLNIPCDDLVFIYSGSIGPQYAWSEMKAIFAFACQHFSSTWIVISPSEKPEIDLDFSDKIRFFSPSFQQIPSFLSAADIAFNFRKGHQSIMAVSPVKLGEYLMCGLPVITNNDIGDLEDILGNTFFYKNIVHLNDHELLEWISSSSKFSRDEIREFAVNHFSIDQAVLSYIEALF
jgi:glycosyltransferase involved in cell wall biosynthesis